MRLFEAIIDANHRAVAGDNSAGLHPVEFAAELPVVALTCMDPRLNALFPNVLGLPGDQFIWLRNSGNVIDGPLSSMMRSLAVACAVHGGKEIAIIGHTDCNVGKTAAMELLDKLKALGIERHLLPENLTEFFGAFGSERQNVIQSCEIARRSPLVPGKIPVHGFLVDIQTGKLEWIVNGYQDWNTMSNRWNEVVKSAGKTVDALKNLGDFQIGEMKFPETKIGETLTQAGDWLSQKIGQIEIKPPESLKPPAIVETAADIARKIVKTANEPLPPSAATAENPSRPVAPPRITPQSPPFRPRMIIRRKGK